MKTQPKQLQRKSDGVIFDVVEAKGTKATILLPDGISTEIVNRKDFTVVKEPKEKKEKVKKERLIRQPKLDENGNPIPPLVPADLTKYAKHTGFTTKSGRVKIDVEDEAAKLLRPLSLDDAIAYVANEVGVSPDALAERYAGRNPGMIRMNIGNILRGELNRRAKAPELEAAKAAKEAEKAAKKAEADAKKVEALQAKEAAKAAKAAEREAAKSGQAQAA